MSVDTWIKAVLSFSVVGASLFIMLTRPDEAARQWAVSAIAFVLGYYLRENQEHLRH